MPETIPAALQTPAPAAPVTPVPASKEQGTPAPVAPQVTPAPAAVKPPDGMVPLPALQEERSKRQELEAEVARLRSQVNQPVQQQQSQGIAQIDPKVELEKLWDTDPRKAVQVEIMYAMDWRDRQDATLNSQADQLAMKYGDFNNYRSSALGYVRNLPAHQRGAPGILEAAYYMVRGQNVDQLLLARETELMEKYRRGEITAQQLTQPAGSFSAPLTAPGSVTLTQDQLAVAAAMGMTPESYASQIKLTPGGR